MIRVAAGWLESRLPDRRIAPRGDLGRTDSIRRMANLDTLQIVAVASAREQPVALDQEEIERVGTGFRRFADRAIAEYALVRRPLALRLEVDPAVHARRGRHGGVLVVQVKKTPR